MTAGDPPAPPTGAPSSGAPSSGAPPSGAPSSGAAGGGRPPPTLEDYDIRIAADGTWFHNGQPIRRPQLVRLFASVLSRLEDGTYWLRTPAERGEITVEDAPFIATQMRIEGEDRARQVTLTTNIGDEVRVGREHPLSLGQYGPDGTQIAYVVLWRGLSARLDRQVWFDLAALAEPAPETLGGESTLGVWIDHHFFPLGQMQPEPAPGLGAGERP